MSQPSAAPPELVGPAPDRPFAPTGKSEAATRLRPVTPDPDGGERRSPLDAAHRRLGAKLVGFGGWQMPLSYPAGTVAEHLACRHGAVAFDVSHLGTVRLAGGDAL